MASTGMADMDKNAGQVSKALQLLRVPCGRGYPTPVCCDNVASRFRAEPVFLGEILLFCLFFCLGDINSNLPVVNPLRTIAQGPHPTPCPNVRSLDPNLPLKFQLLAPVHHLFTVLKTTVTVGVVQKPNA